MKTVYYRLLPAKMLFASYLAGQEASRQPGHHQLPLRGSEAGRLAWASVHGAAAVVAKALRRQVSPAHRARALGA
ncbi:hypothetical protein [Hymenobacter cheonanensis]|uniref:hypothetical protein n=1 Tax=Hymenobacter sp. CA2-7 TaxID=3063993 RepID=UPI002712CE88|nr:hypothetical protein [Hymenobacter sp. CA2-7]MDO7884193.1 hypothetical protein [Hymenobacter sp. CA2-7]